MDANKEALERVLEDAKMHYPDDSGWWRPGDIPMVRAYVSKLEDGMQAVGDYYYAESSPEVTAARSKMWAAFQAYLKAGGKHESRTS